VGFAEGGKGRGGERAADGMAVGGFGDDGAGLGVGALVSGYESAGGDGWEGKERSAHRSIRHTMGETRRPAEVAARMSTERRKPRFVVFHFGGDEGGLSGSFEAGGASCRGKAFLVIVWGWEISGRCEPSKL
jgi:hypothetical protein